VLAIAFYRQRDGIQQVLVAEGLGEKLHGPSLHRLHRHRDVAGDEDDREVHLGCGQLALEVESAESRQPHVEH